MGAEFPVYAPSVDVFSGSHLPKGSGLDLETVRGGGVSGAGNMTGKY